MTVPRFEVTCSVCNKKVQIREKLLKSFKYCSNTCKSKAKESQIPWNKNKGGRIHKVCENIFCKKPFKVIKSLDRMMYCSSACWYYVRTHEYEQRKAVHDQVELEKQKKQQRILFFGLNK